MNIFQRMGNNFEREKKEKELIEKKYWKLSSSERMEYDLKKEKIRRDYFGNFITVVIFKIFIELGIFFLAFGFAIGKLFILIPAVKMLFLFYFQILLWLLLLDLILVIFNSYKAEKERKKLRKRFKLC